MQMISKARFDILAGYARKPGAALLGQEIAWFESKSRQVLALLVLDTDLEYSGILFARDLTERFRAVGQTDFYATLPEAADALDTRLLAAERDLEQLREQGDEGVAMNFFEEVPSRRLHERYVSLARDPLWAPARSVVENMMRWYDDGDGNFVEQFQTSGFDARIWEVYLFAMLIENGYSVTHPSPAPDFLADGLGRRFAVEATTVNRTVIGGEPAPSEKPTAREEVDDYLGNYLPIRYAGPLTNKLGKKYWAKPEVKGLPLLFAIQDFHDQMSMTYSGQALQTYLYGQQIREFKDTDGATTQHLEKVELHEWGRKQVVSGFFELPSADNVSAVLFNGAGTLTKFNRIGVATGFDPDKVLITHHGTRINPEDPAKPIEFHEDVLVGTDETWTDGLWVFHNPRALRPFNAEWLLGAAHVRRDGTQLNASIPDRHLNSSITAMIGRRQTP